MHSTVAVPFDFFDGNLRVRGITRQPNNCGLYRMFFGQDVQSVAPFEVAKNTYWKPRSHLVVVTELKTKNFRVLAFVGYRSWATM